MDSFDDKGITSQQSLNLEQPMNGHLDKQSCPRVARPQFTPSKPYRSKLAQGVLTFETLEGYSDLMTIPQPVPLSRAPLTRALRFGAETLYATNIVTR